MVALTNTSSSNGVNGATTNGTSRRNNDAPGGWVIQKFGGTSVGKFADKIAEEVVSMYLDRNRVAIVCSARSTDVKETGTTNRLMRAASEAMKPDSSEYIGIIDAMRDDHIQASRDTILDEKILAELIKEIESECTKVSRLLSAAQILDEISPRTLDNIIGTGEKLSCLYMTALLQDRGLEAEFINLESIITCVGGPGAAPTIGKEGLGQNFYDSLAVALGNRVKQVENKIPVITGYFGTVPGSLLTQIGRGYTDLCAALVAVGLEADELQIWKEVDGIFTADPRKVSTARLIRSITPEEAAELTYFGSEVIHPFTMEQAIRKRIPIRIKNVMRPEGEGTIVFPDTVSRKGEETPSAVPRHVRLFSEDALLQHRTKRPTAVTVKRNSMVLNIHSNKKALSHDFFANIFNILQRYKLVIDLISTSEVHVSMALAADVRSHELREVVRELEVFGSVEVIKDLAIISLVGKQMKHMVGIAGRMFAALAEFNINIEMISQGASEINISCVIKEADAIRAMNVLHTKLFTYQDALDQL